MTSSTFQPAPRSWCHVESHHSHWHHRDRPGWCRAIGEEAAEDQKIVRTQKQNIENKSNTTATTTTTTTTMPFCKKHPQSESWTSKLGSVPFPENKQKRVGSVRVKRQWFMFVKPFGSSRKLGFIDTFYMISGMVSAPSYDFLVCKSVLFRNAII